MPIDLDMRFDFKEQSANQECHLALRLPEIVSHVLSYLAIPYHYDETNKTKLYQLIYPCLLVNPLWHDCATRLIWRSVTFEDSKPEYEAFLRFASIISNNTTAKAPTDMISSSASAAGLAIAAPKISSLFGDKKFLNTIQKLSHLQKDIKQEHHLQLQQFYYENDLNEDPFFLQYKHVDRTATSQSKPIQRQSYTFSHHSQYRNALRSIALRKIKDKTINEPLQQISHYAHKLEKLDIYICDHLADISVQNFITNNNHSLTYLSLAGCNRITDEAVLSVAKNCPNLEHLDLRACGLISDVSIESIAINCSNLHHLNVGRVRDRERITIQSISLIAIKTKVAVLGLAGCDMSDECLISLAKCRGRGLERISVNNCYRITNKSVQAYVKYCPNLSVFEMKECHWIDDWSSVAELVQRKVLLTLCDQQNRACAEWARRRGRVMEVKAPVK
ncbi:hypothetical protein HPULCUR_000774 [Helicostylum pulchrum]|uniref:F-box/LRR-repeat protein 15-like leucin rich repeat domain-containing protein n=1 Tax=Helicostylum pulchrum TaxID=562976 RepID=A0ABP9XKU1_9FUNG